MLKYIGEDAEPSLWPLSRPEIMRGEEAESFLAASEESLVNWAKDAAISLGDPPEGAEEEARRGFREIPSGGARTPRHYFLKLQDGSGEKVAELWLQLAEDKLSYNCHNIEVDPEKRRMFFGKRMIAFWDTLASRMGVKVMKADIYGENETAQRFFASNGFTTVFKKFVMAAEDSFL